MVAERSGGTAFRAWSYSQERLGASPPAFQNTSRQGAADRECGLLPPALPGSSSASQLRFESTRPGDELLGYSGVRLIEGEDGLPHRWRGVDALGM